MFQTLFALVEVLGLIGIVRACMSMHTYSLNHKWLRHTSQAGAWTVALLYGLAAVIVFWIAHQASGSIYIVLFGVSGFGKVVSYGLFLMVLFVLGHVVAGALLLIPYLARFLAALSSRK